MFNAFQQTAYVKLSFLIFSLRLTGLSIKAAVLLFIFGVMFNIAGFFGLSYFFQQSVIAVAHWLNHADFTMSFWYASAIYVPSMLAFTLLNRTFATVIVLLTIIITIVS